MNERANRKGSDYRAKEAEVTTTPTVNDYLKTCCQHDFTQVLMANAGRTLMTLRALARCFG